MNQFNQPSKVFESALNKMLLKINLAFKTEEEFQDTVQEIFIFDSLNFK